RHQLSQGQGKAVGVVENERFTPSELVFPRAGLRNAALGVCEISWNLFKNFVINLLRKTRFNGRRNNGTHQYREQRNRASRLNRAIKIDTFRKVEELIYIGFHCFEVLLRGGIVVRKSADLHFNSINYLK